MQWKIILLLTALLMASACHDEQPADKSAETARIEKEVARRVEVVENELKTRQHRLHTIRVVGFILLAGGSAAGLLWLRQSRAPQLDTRPGLQQPARFRWFDHYPTGTGRVIEPLPGGRTTPNSQPDPASHETAHRS